jgi:hypothetical protein
MRNIHFTPSVDPEPVEAPCLPRLREKTNDPLTEYSQRPGQVERLPDSVAAIILCKSGASVVRRHEISVTLNKTEYIFKSADSLVLRAKNGTEEKVVWLVNRMRPDVLHLLTNDGRYIESIPLKGEARWFSSDPESQRVLTDAKRSIGHDLAGMKELHGIDTAKAVEDARYNASQIHTLTRTFPVSPQGADQNPQPRAAAPRADNLMAGIARVDQARETRYVPAPISEEEFLST